MSELITLTIDGVEIKAEPGTSILRAALANGIYIPHLCDHPDLTSVGICRVCLVEIEGRRPTVSCMTPVEEGMIVTTASPELDQTRRVNLELLVINHDYNCQNCAKNSDCQLQKLTHYIGLDEERLKAMRKPELNLPLDDSNPYYLRDLNKCVLCGICVRTCEEFQGDGCIDFAFRGNNLKITTPFDKKSDDCRRCGACMYICPVCTLRCQGPDPQGTVCGGCYNELQPTCIDTFDDYMCYEGLAGDCGTCIKEKPENKNKK